MKKAYMLDTNICSFIMRQRPENILLKLHRLVAQQHSIVVSAITYAEMRFGTIGPKASPKHEALVNTFVSRLDGILPWDQAAVDATTRIKLKLSRAGRPIGQNDAAIAGHAIATNSVLVTNNVKEFSRIEGLVFEDWVKQ